MPPPAPASYWACGLVLLYTRFQCGVAQPSWAPGPRPYADVFFEHIGPLLGLCRTAGCDPDSYLDRYRVVLHCLLLLPGPLSDLRAVRVLWSLPAPCWPPRGVMGSEERVRRPKCVTLCV